MKTKLTLAGLAAALLSGCAATVTSSTPRSVIVDAGRPPNLNGASAQRLADAECAKHSRFARMSGRPNPGSNDYVFDCVE